MVAARNIVGGWILGGMLAGLAILPLCDLHFDCGCRLPGFGTHRHCDCMDGAPPDCPWCSQPATLNSMLLFSYGLGLVAAILAGRRRGFVGALVGTASAVVLGALVSGIVTSLVLGRTPLAGAPW